MIFIKLSLYKTTIINLRGGGGGGNFLIPNLFLQLDDLHEFARYFFTSFRCAQFFFPLQKLCRSFLVELEKEVTPLLFAQPPPQK